MTMINRLLGLFYSQPATSSAIDPHGIRYFGNLVRLSVGNREAPNDRPTWRPRPGAARSHGRSRNRRLLVLFALILLPLIAACSRNIGGEADGWNPPVTSGGVVYVGTKDGEVKAIIDDSSGNLQTSWTFPSLSNETNLKGTYNTPLVVGDLVYVTGIDGYIYALNTETGSISDGGWRRPQGQFEEPEPLVAGPAYDPINDLILSPSEDGFLYAYTAKAGEQRWAFETGAAIWSTPVVNNSVGYFGSHDHKIYAVSLSDGEERWQYETGGVVAGKPLLFDGKVIAGSFDKKLYAISAADGTLAWTFEADNWFWAGAVDDGETIFAPNMDGNIYALDKDGNLLWKQDVGASIVSAPVLVPRGLVVAAKDGNLLLLDTGPANSGQQRVLFNQKIGDAEIKAPLFADGNSVYVGSQDRTVRRIEFSNGQRNVWCLDTRNGSCN